MKRITCETESDSGPSKMPISSSHCCSYKVTGVQEERGLVEPRNQPPILPAAGTASTSL